MRYASTIVSVSTFLLVGCATGGGSPDPSHGRSDPPTRATPTLAAGPDHLRHSAIAPTPTPSTPAAAQITVRYTGAGSGATPATDSSAPPGYAPLAVSRSTRPRWSDLPLPDALIGAATALRGDGLPLHSTGKSTDPATLLRVRGDTLMLLWRYPF